MTKQTKNGIQHPLYLGLFTLVIGACTFVNAADIDSFEQSQLETQTVPATEGAKRVQAIPPEPLSFPKKPPYPPVKPGYYQGDLVISGHGGNMVTGETPVSQFSFVSSQADYNALQQAVSHDDLPQRNSINSHQLLNRFDYQFYNTAAVSTNYAIATELAPSPYNQGTHILLVNVELTKDASDKAALGFNWLRAKVKFNPRLVSEYRLIGFENAYQTSSRKRQVTVGNSRQYIALYELRFNEKAEYATTKNVQPANNSIHARYSAKDLAVISLSDGRSSSEQQFIYQYPIDIGQQQKFFEQSSDDFKFAAAVAGLGQLINQNNYIHDFNYNKLIEIAIEATEGSLDAMRSEFIALAKSAAVIAATKANDASGQRTGTPVHKQEPYPMPQPIKTKPIGQLPEGKQQLIVPVVPIPQPKPVNKHI
ncbi:von Willebrand factor type A domain-containing protein [uncultured Shewanella sp.]|uniref:YfbK domain-containing protein n=1 Tax=uncultured Shewanella sp. TaxID=173975 RepID=UPI002622424D|nr:von Willebrand factor type A domain-containing protein [uncultured Shewanella sp.]